jgi:hypothetical protein
MRMLILALALLIGGCAYESRTYYPPPPPPPEETAYYLPPGCFELACGVPLYRSYESGAWVDSYGYRAPPRIPIFFTPLWQSPPAWHGHHARWDRWYWQTYRRRYWQSGPYHLPRRRW